MPILNNGNLMYVVSRIAGGLLTTAEAESGETVSHDRYHRSCSSEGAQLSRRDRAASMQVIVKDRRSFQSKPSIDEELEKDEGYVTLRPRGRDGNLKRQTRTVTGDGNIRIEGGLTVTTPLKGRYPVCSRNQHPPTGYLPLTCR